MSASLHRLVPVATTPPYDVVVGPGALDQLGVLVAGRRMVVVVTQSAIAREYGAPVVEVLRSGGAKVELVGIDDGEEAKTLATVEQLARDLATRGVLRDDALVALGGGVVGDTVGFTASVYHRGIAVVQVPTTLLAQVDAAIGGKTAVNLPEGKNLVGAFHQPVGVIADTATLATLPDRDMRCGLGEVAKYALMPQGGSVAALLDRLGPELAARDPETLAEIVAACARIKAALVAADPQERTGVRATLNYGHTLAHALETVSEHLLAHGEAVAVGLVFAVTLAHGLGRVGVDEVARVLQTLASLGLQSELPAGAGVDAAGLLAVMARDKKASGGLTFVLPGGDGLELVADPPAAALDAAFRAVGVPVG